MANDCSIIGTATPLRFFATTLSAERLVGQRKGGGGGGDRKKKKGEEEKRENS